MGKNIYYEQEDFKLLHGDALLLLKKIEPQSIDMIFADPPYFLSGDGITCSGGKMVSVNKGKWDEKTVWKADSLLLDDDVLEELKLYELFQVANSNYNYYGVTQIAKDEWKLIRTTI